MEKDKAAYLAKDMEAEKYILFIKKVFSYNSVEIFIYSSYRYKTTKEIEIQRKD